MIAGGPEPLGAEGDPGRTPGRAALLGHDLRAAVSDILGGLRLIDPSALDEAGRLQFERVRLAAEALAGLLEEGLALMLGEGAAPGPASRATLLGLLHDVELRWSGRAQEKGLGFELAVGPGIPEGIALDRIAFERVISNLLSNALRVCDRGTVRLSVALAGDGALVVRVEDEGPGFPPEILAGGAAASAPRGEAPARPRAGGGLGLGLRITREMAARLGGRIALANRPGGGAEAVLTLPPEAWRPAQTPPAAPALADLRGRRVLVAEDSPTNQTLIRSLLGRLGATAVVAGDGVEALARLAEEPVDLALIDIEMPRLSGLEVIRRIRARPGPAGRLPILAVTAYVLRANREVIFAAGADGILPKPIHGIESFSQAIEAAMGRVRAEGPPPPPSAPGAAGGPGLDRAQFERLIEIAGPATAPELVRRLAADLAAAERGLVRALGAGDTTEVRAHTHVLIALSGAVGAGELQRLAEAVNRAAHRGEVEAFETLGGALLRELDHLIHFIACERDLRRETAG